MKKSKWCKTSFEEYNCYQNVQLSSCQIYLNNQNTFFVLVVVGVVVDDGPPLVCRFLFVSMFHLKSMRPNLKGFV